MADTKGTGHCSCSVNNEPRFSVFVPLVDQSAGQGDDQGEGGDDLSSSEAELGGELASTSE
eukprot:3425838-Pyramimonas_sp.AAC.1